MKVFVKRMIDEHIELVNRIRKLNNYIISDKSDEDDRIEFTNKCVQLSYMKKYAEALETRLFNQGIIYENGEYLERVNHNYGSDFDEDSENLDTTNE